METTLVNYKGHVATITIDRPKAPNALNTQVLTELNQTLGEVVANNDIHALVLTGAGEEPSTAGADITEMEDKSVEETVAYGEFGNGVFHKIETSRCPVIAAINGFALGGGCELAMGCDIRVASENVVFGQPEVGSGIILGFDGIQRLARLVGTSTTKEAIYIARNIKVECAYAIGLVNNVVPAEELTVVVMKMANGITKNALIAVAHGKKAINNGLWTDTDGGVTVEVEESSSCLTTEDWTYGIACFPEKTKDKEFPNK